MGKITMQVFWMAFMAMALAAAMWSMTILASLSSTHLYSQAIDASVTTATVNQVLNSGVQIANSNAAAVASISRGKEENTVNYTNITENPSLAPQPAPQPTQASGWSLASMVFGLLKFAGWLAVTAMIVFVMKKVV